MKEKILVILLRPCITDLVLAREYHLVRVPRGSFVFSGVFRCCGSLGDQFQVGVFPSLSVGSCSLWLDRRNFSSCCRNISSLSPQSSRSCNRKMVLRLLDKATAQCTEVNFESLTSYYKYTSNEKVGIVLAIA